jgi:hypothetical protein
MFYPWSLHAGLDPASGKIAPMNNPGFRVKPGVTRQADSQIVSCYIVSFFDMTNLNKYREVCP